jgi:hypothetical protein
MKPIKHFISKSLFGTGILAVLLLAFSCTQDIASEDLGSEELNAVSLKGKKARPIKGDVSFLFDFANPSILTCVAGAPIELFQGLVSGNLSHLGKLQPGQSPEGGEPIIGSYILPDACKSSGFPNLETVYTGILIAANGDQLRIRTETIITFDLPVLPDVLPSGTFTGTGTFEGGDGRFDGASGTFDMLNGSFAEGKVQFQLEGMITY